MSLVIFWAGSLELPLKRKVTAEMILFEAKKKISATGEIGSSEFSPLRATVQASSRFVVPTSSSGVDGAGPSRPLLSLTLGGGEDRLFTG